METTKKKNTFTTNMAYEPLLPLRYKELLQMTNIH